MTPIDGTQPEFSSHTEAAGYELAQEIDKLSTEGLAALAWWARHWRANLHGKGVELVEVVDAFREVGVAKLADHYGATPDEIRSSIAEALAEEGETDG